MPRSAAIRARRVHKMSETSIISSKRHLLTVLLEDYFHVGAFNRLIQRGQWYRFETRFEQNTIKALDLLDRYNIKATFFVLGWIADQSPEIVKEVARRGHEIASRGYYHRTIRQMTPTEFREDLQRAREALERASGMKILGYRAAHRLSAPSDLWALDVLAEEGYAYDSSFVPNARASRQEPNTRFAHKHHHGERDVWEFPVSTFKLGGWMVPIAGGNYFRQIPHTLLRHAVDHWDRTYDAPFVMYFHVWELDPEQPRISAASTMTRLRHYRKLDKMEWVLQEYFSKYKFVGGADYLGLTTSFDESNASVKTLDATAAHVERLPIAEVSSQPSPLSSRQGSAPGGRIPASIIVPCFNEELALHYLSKTLESVEATLEKDYDLCFIFVDDGSTDQTWNSLKELFGDKPNSKVIQHKQNRGVAASILTGIRQAETEIVCSIDCDCTYDPHELNNMIPLLTEGVDMVTASPYHPNGAVRNVPTWRLSLSKASSFLYRHVLRQKLYTYTSCFRIYRRSAVVDLKVREGGFLGVAEVLGRLDLGGAKIVEYPATLEVRLFGWSKMKILGTIAGHLRLLSRLLVMRIVHRGGASPRGPIGRQLLAETSLETGYQPTSVGTQKFRT
jgi:polysaccharide deacetylase family protein (PEP-CTERM system associated)